jgi:predicted 2-oxoglutarate/Fe(II)-dependent dioxygenase YbiX
MIAQIDGAMSKEECEHWVGVFGQRKQGRDVRPELYFHPGTADEKLLGRLRSCTTLCRSLFDVSEKLFPETVILMQFLQGSQMGAHADNCRRDGKGEWVPNHTPDRDVTAIFYLSEGFTGGELVFPELGLSIKPRRGLLVAFPSDGGHMHQVNRVESGERYTLTAWMTKSENVSIWAKEWAKEWAKADRLRSLVR